MKVPNFEDIKVVNSDGLLTNEWRQIFTQLFNQMHSNLSDEGLIAPSQTTANIAQLASTEKNGALFNNSDTDSLQVILNGIVKTVTVT